MCSYSSLFMKSDSREIYCFREPRNLILKKMHILLARKLIKNKLKIFLFQFLPNNLKLKTNSHSNLPARMNFCEKYKLPKEPDFQTNNSIALTTKFNRLQTELFGAP